MSKYVTVTAALAAQAERDGNGPTSTIGTIVRLHAHIAAGGDMRTPPADWRPSFHADDPRNEPDMWVTVVHDPTIWCKRDDHPPYEPDTLGVCSWCGMAHRDRMYVYTFMLPEDY